MNLYLILLWVIKGVLEYEQDDGRFDNCGYNHRGSSGFAPCGIE